MRPRRLVRQIEPRGGTNLGAGWFADASSSPRPSSPAAGARCLLMSDGHANDGIVDRQELELHARERSSAAW